MPDVLLKPPTDDRRDGGGGVPVLRLAAMAARAQFQLMRRDREVLFPMMTVPLASLATLAILTHSGRADLAGYALVSVLLMSVGQMGLYMGSEILANERQGQIAELIVASPSPYAPLLFTRIGVLSGIGVLGFMEAWLIARLVFGIHVQIHYPLIFLATVVLTILAGAATSLITSAWFCFGKSTRTYQNALAGPLYLLAGVLVPVTFLPVFLQPFSRLLFLYWSADLLRDSLQSDPPEAVAVRLGAIAALGVAGGVTGTWLIRKVLDHQRREGTLGL